MDFERKSDSGTRWLSIICPILFFRDRSNSWQKNIVGTILPLYGISHLIEIRVQTRQDMRFLNALENIITLFVVEQSE